LIDERDRERWARRLKASGFKDIETRDGGLATAVRTDAKSVLSREGDEVSEYHRRAAAFLHEHKFRSAEERRIWALNVEGASYRRMAAATGRSDKYCWTVVDRLERLMLGRRRGRPPKPDGRGDGAYRLPGVRLSAEEAEAFAFLIQRLGVGECEAVRLCIRAQALIVAGRISERGKAGGRGGAG
jgi:hypothetical protein